MKKIISVMMFILSCGLFIPMYFEKNYNGMLIAILIMWMLGVVTSLFQMKKNLIFLIFSGTFFTFLLSRPTISMFRGDIWWYFDDENVLFSMIVLMISVSFLYLGSILGGIDKKEIIGYDYFNEEFQYLQNLKIVSLVIYGISLSAYIVLGVEKLSFTMNHSYEEYYTSFESSMPYIVYVISTFYKYSLCMYLVTRPSKSEAFLPLVLYVFSALPELIIGIRNPIVLNVIFAFLYYCLRDIVGDKEKWIGKFEKTAIIVAMPFVLAFLGAYNYIRENSAVKSTNIMETIVDLFYKQGVSYDVINIAYGTIPYLPERNIRNYTFGGFIDYFLHGSIGQLFGGTPLPPGNNIENALQSNSFAHNMSYISRGQEYLDGHGWGTSYILETYVDYGYAGVAISSLILGFLCVFFVKFIKKNIYTFYFTLLALTSLFFVPRAEATGWISFVLTMQFWVSTIVIVLCSKMCNKVYFNKGLKYKGEMDNV